MEHKPSLVLPVLGGETYPNNQQAFIALVQFYLPPLGNEWPEETLVPVVSMRMCPAGLVEEKEAFPDPSAVCGMVDTST